MPFRNRVSFLLLSISVVSALGFGPRFEPLKGGRGERAGRTAHSRSASFSNEDHEHEGPESSSWNTYSLHYENRYETGRNGELIHSRVFISKPFVVDASMFGLAHLFDLESFVDLSRPAIETNGQDDDDDDVDCAIPDRYKIIAENNGIDVMAYLGITRAKPLRVNSPSDSAILGEWE